MRARTIMDNQRLTKIHLQEHDSAVAAHQRCGFDSPENRRTSRLHRGFFHVRWHGPQFRAAVRGIFGCAGSYSRSVNPHGLPSPFDSGEGGEHHCLNRTITMPKIPGADARLSRTLQSLDRFTPAGIEALACVGPVSYTHLTLPTSDLV